MRYIRIITLLLTLSTFGLTFASSSMSASALPASPIVADLKDDANSGLGQVGGGGTTIAGIVSDVVTLLSYVAGVAAIIMIIISGLRYTTSGGDSAKVSSAKNALIYALVGIAVASLAQFLVHLVLNKTS